MESVLLYPGALAIISGIVAYFYQLVQKWRAVSALFESEINHLLADARENLDFLDRPSHYWLTPGAILKATPNAFAPKYRVLDAILKDIHVLGRRKAKNVLAFYEYHAFCENLRQSLFEHVRTLREARKELDAAEVETLRARLVRVCAAYRRSIVTILVR